MSLLSKIENGSAVVGVIGLGYVGLPLLSAFHGAGMRVIGFDIDPKKIRALRSGENYLKHLGATMVCDMLKKGRFEAVDDFSRLGEADAIISCVPTPLGTHLEPDLSYVEKTADDIAKTLRPGQLIVLESTSYPRTTREIMLPRFEARGLKCGQDFYLAFSPGPQGSQHPHHSQAGGGD
jgi:UDP-N-acetyl-D-glucosamine dehydrogenase